MVSYDNLDFAETLDDYSLKCNESFF